MSEFFLFALLIGPAIFFHFQILSFVVARIRFNKISVHKSQHQLNKYSDVLMS